MAVSNGILHVHQHFNPEEAAHTAAEFVASLDNLPAEVEFLLEEITEKDQRITQLLTRINTRHYGLTKHSKNITASSSSGTSSPTFPLPIGAGQPLPVNHLSTKDQQAMTKIQAEWGKVEALQEEKIKLAERLDRIVSRARERGRAEWKKVGGMDLEEIEKQEGLAMGMSGEMGGNEVLLPPGGLGPGSDSRAHKKRRPHALPLPLPSQPLPTNHIIHPPATSMPPPALPTRPSLSARSANSHRHSRHISTSTLSEDPDADGEGEMEVAEGDTGDTGDADDTIYCLCQQKSYGEMIGCDNASCQYEWFHVKCVAMSGPLPETWYCPDCVRKLGLSSSDGSRAGGPRDKKRRK